MVKKFVCSVCGYVHEGDCPPEFCPTCKVGPEKFIEQSGQRQWAAEHVVGVAAGAPEDIIAEIQHLAAEGYQEVTLLGQNVNAYGKDFKDREYTFGDLLNDLNKFETWLK